eukprot:TRINITY_DN21182_c0_g1_i1.p1 TRINITY_DN21182_c0_g1~~TRINITY_DN21182_c0_g1_i1.p1  ORF type:complete len:823 (+),score=139.03 TRINITY_DN21182_c0_g1_i1:241-2709(+)
MSIEKEGLSCRTVQFSVVGESSKVQVDLEKTSVGSELLQRLRIRSDLPSIVTLPRFPGGSALLKSVIAHLESAADVLATQSQEVVGTGEGAEKDSDAKHQDGASDLVTGHRVASSVAALTPTPSVCLSFLNDPPISAESIELYLEAAILLESPRLLHDLAQGFQLTPGQASPLLALFVSLLQESDDIPAVSSVQPTNAGGSVSTGETRFKLMFTAICRGTAAPLEVASPGDDSGCRIDSAIAPRQGPLSEAVWLAVEQVIVSLSNALDPRDFRLGPPLAKGCTRVCLALLRAYRIQTLNASGVASTKRSSAAAVTNADVLSTAASRQPSFVGGRSLQRVEWTEHQYALYVSMRHLERATLAALAAGTARVPPAPLDASLLGAEESAAGENEHASWNSVEDLDDELCDVTSDEALRVVADFVEHFDEALLPPKAAGVAVRALLLVGKESNAERLFETVFPRSLKVRVMVAIGEIPVRFLRGVAGQPAASQTLRWMLARYESMDPEVLCGLIENILLAELVDEAHSHDEVIQHPLTRDIVVWMRSGGVVGGARLGAKGYVASASDGIQERLREVGVRLFEVAFVPSGGFFAGTTASTAEKPVECPWESGVLDLPLLARVPPVEDALQLARRVILHYLRRRSTIDDVREFARVWPLGRWQLCRDAVLIGEAFAFLANCWKTLTGLPGLGDTAGPPPADCTLLNFPGANLLGVGGDSSVGYCSRRVAEELLFKMFTDLEIWRLPPGDLLTPWVPGSVIACHVAAQCKQLEERQFALVEETRENLDEIARLHAVISQLTARLEATDARSQQCMQKQADVNDTLRQLR